MMRKKTHKHIEIVRATKLGYSSMGRKSSEAAYNLLKKHYTTVGISIVNTLDDLEQLVSKQPDLVFMGAKYVPGNGPDTKVWISEYLDRHGINHTGSPESAIKLEQNKPLAKQRILDSGIKTSPYAAIKRGDTLTVTDSTLQFPLFVKPIDMGAGQGVDEHSVVHTQEELDNKVASLAVTFGADALVEEFLSGREYSVAVLKDEHSHNLIAMPLELVAGPDENGYRMLSHKLKSAALETPVFPVVDSHVRAALIELATSAFIALGARDYGRIDIRMDESGTPHFLEANLIPCLIRDSGNFPKACAMNIGLGYEDMMLHIVRLGLMRTTTRDIETETDSSTIHAPAVTVMPA